MTTSALRVFFLLSLLSAPLGAQELTEDQRKGIGENRQGAFEFGLQLGGHLFRAGSDDPQQLKNAFHTKLWLGYRALRAVGIEAGLGLTPTGASDNSAGVFVLHPHIDVNFDLLQFRVRPYVGLGFGGMFYTAAVNPTSNLEGHFQGGLKVSVWRDLALRAEAKVLFHTALNPIAREKPFGFFANATITGGVMYAIGGKLYRIDRDKDGVYDEDDRCPDVPGEAQYDGCPPPKDSDGDGINDDKDQCPEIPGVIDFNGCPAPDQDGDGVIDPKDKCPAEPGKPENDGCPEQKIEEEGDRLILGRHARFDTNKSEVLEEYAEVLDALVKFLRRHIEIELVGIYGHTDIEGPRQRNQILSVERSEAVKRYLLAKGIDKSRLLTKGFGQDKPIASNKSPEGRAKNRRVEFVVLKRSDTNVSVPSKQEPQDPGVPGAQTPPEPARMPVTAPTPTTVTPAEEPARAPVTLPPSPPAKTPATPTVPPAPPPKTLEEPVPSDQPARKPLQVPTGKPIEEPSTPVPPAVPTAPVPAEKAKAAEKAKPAEKEKPADKKAKKKEPPKPTEAPVEEPPPARRPIKAPGQ